MSTRVAAWLERAEALAGRLTASRVAAAIAFALVAAFGAAAVQRAVDPERSSEFRGFREIVQASLVRGEDHYQTIAHIRAYPPFFALGFAPFGLPPVPVGATLFVALSLAFGAWAAWLTAGGCQPAASRPGRAVLLWLLCAGFIGGAIARCESDMLVLLPVAGAFWLLSRPGQRCAFWAGALLGFAAALKALPALFGLYLLVQRRWAALAGMAASGLVLIGGLGTLAWGVEGNIARHRSWLQVVVLPIGREGPNAVVTTRAGTGPIIGRPYRTVNQSVTAALFRFLTAEHAERLAGLGRARSNVASLAPRTVFALASGVRLVLLAALVVAWWLAARSRDDWLPNAAAFGLAALGTFFFSPVALHSHHPTLMVAFGVCFAALSADPGSQRSGIVGRLVVAAVVAMLLSASSLGKALSMLAVTDLLLAVALILLIVPSGRKDADR